MTLQEMMLEVAQNTFAKITLPYNSVSDPKNNATKILTSLNYIYKKIARERYNLVYKENVTLDSNQEFDTKTLSKTFYKIKNIDTDIWDNGELIKCPSNAIGDTLTLEYCYIPSDLTFADMTEEPLVKCDHRILCYYASFQFLQGNGQNTNNWLDLFNDGFSTIRQTRGKSKRVGD